MKSTISCGISDPSLVGGLCPVPAPTLGRCSFTFQQGCEGFRRSAARAPHIVLMAGYGLSRAAQHLHSSLTEELTGVRPPASQSSRELERERAPLTMIRESPYNAEAPDGALTCDITPTEQHYVRSNFELPAHDGTL